MMPRRAARRDANEPEIVAALEAAGATVERWSVVDLIVGYRGRTYLLEITNPEHPGAHPLHKADQARWRARWRGHCVEVFTTAEALAAIGAL